MENFPIGFKKINTKSVVQSVIDTITDAIVLKKLKKGDQLPSEPDLAEMLGVGRSSVREAIKILVYLGILEIRRAEGTFVSEGFKASMIDPLVYGVFLIDNDNLDSLIEIRLMIESGIAKLAMSNKNEENLALVEEKVKAMEDALHNSPKNKVFENLFKADDEFHDALAKTCQNHIAEKLNYIIRSLTYSVRVDTVKMMLKQGRAQELVDGHRDIYNFIKNNDTHNIDAKIIETFYLDDFYKEKGIIDKDGNYSP